LSQTQLQRLQQCCGEIHEDDCIDPRKFFQPERDNKENHKGKQLCRQAFDRSRARGSNGYTPRQVHTGTDSRPFVEADPATAI